MLNGHQTLGSLEKALQDLSREEADLDAQIERTTRSLAELQNNQNTYYRDLARFRLDTDQAQGLDIRLDEASREAMRLMEKRAQDHRTLNDQLRQKEATRTEVQKKRDALIEQRDRTAEQIDALMDEVDTVLEQDAAYQSQTQEMHRAVETATAARSKAERAIADRDAKGEAYKSDRLFTYLWDRGFGTPSYDKRGIIRFLDRWVARLIKFEGARANYAMLTSIPDRLASHATKREAIAVEEQQKLALMSRKTMTKLAGEDLAGNIEVMGEQIITLGKELDTLDPGIETLVTALRNFANGEDADFVKAEEHLSFSLRNDDLQSLWREALATPSPEDERIIRRIEEAREQGAILEQEIRQDRQLKRDISARRTELASVSRNFRQSGYDDWNSTFSDNTLTTILLGELVKGAITGAEYWARAQRSHKRRRPRGGRVGFPDGIGLPGPMRDGFDGGFGGGFGGGNDGFSSGDSFGGGGFTTGDTF